MNENLYLILMSVTLVAMIFFSVVITAFEYRNPLSNKMALFRNFKEVVTFQKMDCYQIKD